jgi:hypothetical protein
MRLTFFRYPGTLRDQTNVVILRYGISAFGLLKEGLSQGRDGAANAAAHSTVGTVVLKATATETVTRKELGRVRTRPSSLYCYLMLNLVGQI